MPTPKDPRPEQERVTEAYENIARRLEQLKNGEEDESSSDEISDDEKFELAVSSPKNPTKSNDSKDDEDELEDETDPLDDESEEENDDEPLDQDEDEEETPLEKKGDKLVEEDNFDEVNETSNSNLQSSDKEDQEDDLDEEPQETLSQRGEKLREEEKMDTRDKYEWKSFSRETDDDSPKRLDDLADEEDKNSEFRVKNPEGDSLEDKSDESRKTPDSSYEDDEMPIPKIHHASNTNALGTEDRRGGLSSRPSYQQAASQNGYEQGSKQQAYNQDLRPSFGSDNSRQEFNINRPKSSKWHLLILILIGLAVIGGTVYLLKNQFGTGFISSPSPSAVAAPTTAPTPTPLPTVNPTEFKVRVLNGTSTSGLAKEVMDKFKELGYQSDRTGNATNSAFTTTFVRVKEGTGSATLLDQIIKALSPDYSAQAGPALKDNDTADVEVILGK